MTVTGPNYLKFNSTPGTTPSGSSFEQNTIGANAVDGRLWYRVVDGGSTYAEIAMRTWVTAGFQPLDATLTAFAGTTIAADKLPYGNGSDSFSTTDLTSAARTVLDDATVGAMLDTLGGTTHTGTGGVVCAMSPSFVTPALGTPASGVLTNCTGLPVVGGGTGASTLTNHGVLIGQATSAIVATSAGTAGYPLVSGGASADPSFSSNAGIRSVAVTIGNGTDVITTSLTSTVCVPYGCSIISHDLVSVDSSGALVSGSVVLTLKKAAYSSLPPTSSIVASAPPTLSAATKAQDLTLTGWTTAISAGDYLLVGVSSVSSCKQIIFTLFVRTT